MLGHSMDLRTIESLHNEVRILGRHPTGERVAEFAIDPENPPIGWVHEVEKFATAPIRISVTHS